MRSWCFLFSCNLMGALQFTCIKLVQDQVGSLFTVCGPMTLATVMLYPLIRREKRDNCMTGERWKKDIFMYLVLASLGVFPGQVMITWGTRMSLAGNAALLALTLPISTAIMAFFFLGEKMTPLRWISFALAIAGVLMCSDVDFRSLNLGASYLFANSLIFLGTLGSAFYNSYGSVRLQRK